MFNYFLSKAHGATRRAIILEVSTLLITCRLRKWSWMVWFRFQDLEIWQLAIQITGELFDIADELEKKRLYRFAEQLRGSGMSMSNNIAEGSGSSSKREFHQFLNIARRSTFENANISILLQRRSLIDQVTLDSLLEVLDHLCRKITNFQKTLK